MAKRPKRRLKTPKASASRKASSTRKIPNARPRTNERPTLDRTRRVLPDEERFEASTGYPGKATELLSPSSRTGRDLKAELLQHTEASPAMTAGDPDARWQDAYAVGDEAPGGDNPTPDQDRVDEIGRALGIEYADNQELEGGAEVTRRDKHRWELDPASSEDWPHGDKDKK